MDPATVTRDAVEANIVRCPDPAMADQMIALIDGARKDGDCLGGVVEAVARGVPAGLGEPVFDKLEADLAKAMLSLPACKGFESGSGFAGTRLRGSQHNDPFYNQSGRIRTRTNRSGGIQGGISNGEDIVIRAAFKPTATILREQQTVDVDGNETTLKPRGRHDPCVLPRAVPMVEAMMALVLADHYLRQRAIAIELSRLASVHLPLAWALLPVDGPARPTPSHIGHPRLRFNHHRWRQWCRQRPRPTIEPRPRAARIQSRCGPQVVAMVQQHVDKPKPHFSRRGERVGVIPRRARRALAGRGPD